MTTRAPGSPPQGSVWIVCALRLATEPKVKNFERRMLSGSPIHWDRFWTTPPLRPSEAVFEMDERTHNAQRDHIDAWEIGKPVGPVSESSRAAASSINLMCLSNARALT